MCVALCSNVTLFTKGSKTDHSLPTPVLIYLFYQGYILFYSSVTEQSFMYTLLSNSVFYLATAILIDSIIYFSNYKSFWGSYSSLLFFFFYLYHNSNISPALSSRKVELS